MDKRVLAAIVAVVVVGAVVLVVMLSGDDDTPEVADTPDTAGDAPDDPDETPDDDGTPAEDPENDDETDEGGEHDENDADEATADPTVETVVEGLSSPWGLAFLGGGPELLVTQLGGALSLIDTDSGEVTEIDGVPDVVVEGQGGLLDVAVHPDHPDEEWIYLTYSGDTGDGATSTHLARARLDVDAGQLDDLEVLFVADPPLGGPPQHYGSRVVFGEDGNVYVTIGDRANKDFDDHPSQDPSNHLGTTIRLQPDGSIPDDNPFVDDPDVADEIYTYGHRNAQGMTVHPDTGAIWQSEHGEEDGDEINVLEAGGNFGWPVATTGCEYGTDTPVGDLPEERDDTVAPVYYWECGTGGFAPGGMTFATGDAFPDWEGDLFVTGLPQQELARFTVDDDGNVEEAERLLGDEGWRLRDVEVGPHDGALYIAIDADDTPLVRLVPADG